MAGWPAARYGIPHIVSHCIEVAIVFLSLTLSSIRTMVQKFFSSPQPAKVPPPAPVGTTGDAQPVDTNPHNRPPVNFAPIWPLGTVFDLHCAVSTSPYDPYSSRVAEVDGDLPRFSWDGIVFGDWKDQRAEDFMLNIPEVRELRLTASLDLTTFSPVAVRATECVAVSTRVPGPARRQPQPLRSAIRRRADSVPQETCVFESPACSPHTDNRP